MKKVITYGTFDLMHYGHLNLLERAKALGDYLIVGVTADDFDKTRGKINGQQSLVERIEAVSKTGLADEIIVEEYEGQKIDDIVKHEVDVFAIGSDWIGLFDYLKDYCEVIYLPRTEGISSSDIREKNRSIKIGIVGNSKYLEKVLYESKFVDGVHIVNICCDKNNELSDTLLEHNCVTNDYSSSLDSVDGVYIHSYPQEHYKQVKMALERGKHVICESPIAMSRQQCIELYDLAEKKNIVLMDTLRTAYSTAFNRLILLAKTGKIGNIVSIDATSTSLKNKINVEENGYWNSITSWGPTALLPVFKMLGENYVNKKIITHFRSVGDLNDSFCKIHFLYKNATATVFVGNGVKSEGQLIISGTKGYIFVPAPWWKTDYFEIRYENQSDNKRYFYQFDGEGIRQELVAFAKAINGINTYKVSMLSRDYSILVCSIMEDFANKRDVIEI